MISAGIGGSITGQGADLLIIDDPIKNRKEAESQTYRDSKGKKTYCKDGYAAITFTYNEETIYYLMKEYIPNLIYL